MSPAQLRLIETVRGHLRLALEQDWRDATYARGAAGQLLALAALDELAVARGAPPSLDAGWLAERLARLLSQLPRYPHGLFQGVQGLLFAALELDRVHALGMAEEMARDADEHLMECLRSGEGLPEHFDLIGGLSGLLVYAAYREQQGGDLPLAEACLRRRKSPGSAAGVERATAAGAPPRPPGPDPPAPAPTLRQSAPSCTRTRCGVARHRRPTRRAEAQRARGVQPS